MSFKECPALIEQSILGIVVIMVQGRRPLTNLFEQQDGPNFQLLLPVHQEAPMHSSLYLACKDRERQQGALLASSLSVKD